MRPDFTTCANDFLNGSADVFSNYVYQGPVQGILATAARPVLMTVQGCRELCGTGVDYYSWKDASNTITTWLLPICGLLLQVPYESNKNWATFLVLSRWVGNPIASLSYLFWNIKVTGKCALMVDMATRYEEYPNEDSEFSLMRDSLFILCVMNQYSIKHQLPPVEAERLLRLALFSNILQLKESIGDTSSLVKRRTELAKSLREGRKKGIIPVFISFMWFVFALALSVQLAFWAIGDNATAHNLAIGYLTGWLPILVLACTVDRNIASADSIGAKFNYLVDDVRQALLDTDIREVYMRNTNTGPEDFAWIGPLYDETIFDGTFFTEFAGQGRTHWHYGVAHPILAGIEAKFMAEYGRDWLREGYAARLAIVVGSRNLNGLKMFDPRMIWQITSSLFVVCGSVGGAFILSYFTPTEGLGCRSGGYFVYITMAVGLLIVEMFVWWLTHESTHTSSDPVARIVTGLERRLMRSNSFSQRRLTKRLYDIVISSYTTLTFRDLMKNLFIRPCEIFNTGWLAYNILAQVFGAYQTCDCMASLWAPNGGYVDFQSYDAYKFLGIYNYWIAATGLSLTVMTAGLAYIVEEYCTQSHLSTEHYGRAMQGLKQTRRYKNYTLFARAIPSYLIKATKWFNSKISGGKMRSGRRSLVWTAKAKEHQTTMIPNSDVARNPQEEDIGRGTIQTGVGVEDPKSMNERQEEMKNHQMEEVSSPSSYASHALDVEKAETNKL